MDRIKVLFIHNQLVCGGAEQALYDLVLLLDKKKFDITVMVQWEGGIWDEKFHKAGIHLISVWSFQKKSHNPFIKISNALQRHAIRKALDNDGNGVLDICTPNQYDIVVSYNVWQMLSMGFASGAKTLKYIHGDASCNLGLRDNLLKNLATIKKFDRYIAVSQIAKESFQNITGITDHISVHFNPIDSDKVHKLAMQEIPWDNSVYTICAVGRLVQEKGFARLIRIHKRLLEKGIMHRLVIVGDGPEKENLEDLIVQLAVTNTVVLAGYQCNPYPYIKNSYFLVCSSYTEGLSVVSMEALCLGVPIVSSAPTVGELFGNEICGIIAENDDASLETAIRKMLEDTGFYASALAGARRRQNAFEGKKMAREVETELLQLVQG